MMMKRTAKIIAVTLGVSSMSLYSSTEYQLSTQEEVNSPSENSKGYIIVVADGFNDPTSPNFLSEYNSFNASTLEDNVVYLDGTLVEVEYVSAGTASGGVAQNNKLYILSGKVEKAAIGAESLDQGAQNNAVYVYGGSVHDVIGAIGANETFANDNLVSIASNITINGSVTGAFVLDGIAKNNNVILGDNVVINGAVNGSSAATTHMNNTVTLGQNVYVAGYISGGTTQGFLQNGTSGHTLNLNGHGSSAAALWFFDNIHFNINTNQADIPLFTLNILQYDLTNVNFTANINGPVNVGDRYNLMTNVTGNTEATNIVLGNGLSAQYQGQFNINANTLALDVLAASLNPQTKSASEGRIAGIAMVNQGVDMAASTVQALSHDWTAGTVQGFINTGGSSARYKSGSHVDLDGTSLIAGIATRTEFGVLGGFFEAGEGNYGSVNTFTNAPSVKGSGHTRYTGVGLLGRYDLTENLYLDGTLSTGRARLNYSSKNWCDNQGQCADYSNSVGYSSTSLTLGYDMPVTGATSVNLRSGMNWTHMNGASTHIGDDPYTFAGTDSKRWINGIRISHDLLEHLAVYGGGWLMSMSSMARPKALRWV